MDDASDSMNKICLWNNYIFQRGGGALLYEIYEFFFQFIRILIFKVYLKKKNCF